MDARELRIDNWVKQIRAHVQVTGSMIQEINQELLDVDHIPLTEEWLLKFGFNKVEQTSCNLTGKEIIFHTYSKGALTYNTRQNLWYIGNLIFDNTRLEYVHQLQNLIFALTGEELTIKQSQL